jgi:hypothetical protein
MEYDAGSAAGNTIGKVRNYRRANGTAVGVYIRHLCAKDSSCAFPEADRHFRRIENFNEEYKLSTSGTQKYETGWGNE